MFFWGYLFWFYSNSRNWNTCKNDSMVALFIPGDNHLFPQNNCCNKPVLNSEFDWRKYKIYNSCKKRRSVGWLIYIQQNGLSKWSISSKRFTRQFILIDSTLICRVYYCFTKSNFKDVFQFQIRRSTWVKLIFAISDYFQK